MITKSDLEISNQSFTKKDFYQIYPELNDWVRELTDMWDPTDTNESDPGVVLLKIAAFVADKLNYNIDKNILEAYITSATQEESMKRLCDMLGYNIKYYNSATTEVSFMWTGSQLIGGDTISEDDDISITLPKFTTVITNNQQDINYVLTEDVYLNKQYETKVGVAIEGELVELDINDDGILLASNIDNKNRFYLPETQIAENGIWIYNASDTSVKETTYELEWKKVDNLNTVLSGSRVWKFGYDSFKHCPFIEFPKDYNKLFDAGLKVYYIRTSGVNGNIKANTLTQLVNDTLTLYNHDAGTTEDVTASENLIVKNLYSTINGCDMQTLDEVYQGFKTTIGTFDTLVTCRDYANAIYNMVTSVSSKTNVVTDTTPLVSNCQVSDIRDELNSANKVVVYNDSGLNYIDVAVSERQQTTVYDSPTATQGYTAYVDRPLINDFDLYIYPLNTIKNAYTQETYTKSFQPVNPAESNTITDINYYLRDYKTISHKIKQFSPNNPDDEEKLYLLKNYYSLKAKIITKNKVGNYEALKIKENIYNALYKNFNPRQLEYGEEIPYERLYEVIKNADTRIASISLDEPILTPKYMPVKGEEGELKYDYRALFGDKQNRVYRKIVAKNILGGRIPLFDYNTNITEEFNIKNSDNSEVYGNSDGNTYYTGTESGDINNLSLTYIDTSLELDITNSTTVKLNDNENIQIISPRLLTEVTYPMYVNYYWSGSIVNPSTIYTLKVNEKLFIEYQESNSGIMYWIEYYNDGGNCYKKTWTNGTLKSTVTFSGIIFTTFKLEDSAGYSGRRSIESGWPTDWNSYIQGGLISLNTNQEIQIKTKSSTNIEKKALVYWLTNNNNTITFTEENGDWVYVLNDNEYFFYTNSAKTDLISLGSGTKLTYHSDTPLTSLEWKLQNDLHKQESVTADSVARNGLGAFENSDWVIKNFDAKNYLKVQQMDIISLGKDDSISGDYTVTYNIISSDWKSLSGNDLTYNLSDGTTGTISSTDLYTYEIRAILNLNLGPNKVQKLENTSTHTQSITLFTNSYHKVGESGLLKNDDILYYLTYDPSAIEEGPKVEVSTDITNTGIKSNLNIEKSGGKGISLHTTTINGSNKDNLLIYPVNVSEATVYRGVNHYTFNTNDKIDWSKDDSVTLPIYIPNDNYALLTLNVTGKTGDHGKVVLNVDSSKAVFQVFPNICETAYTNEVNLQLGLNIIKINKISDLEDYTLKIAKVGTTDNGSIEILGVKLINDNGSGNYGLNNEVFDMPSSSMSKFLSTDIAPFTNYNFYATVDIDNSMLLDLGKNGKMSDPEVLFNYNNEVNKFVLAELDCKSFENIEISSSSKLK